MNDINSIKQALNNLLDINNDFVIFDVDRTIINTTSWYQACICEDLLISSKDIKNFKQINDTAFRNPTPQVLEKFRIETFNLIEKNISKEFLNKIQEIEDAKTYFKLNDKINLWKFYIAGVYTARNLVSIYESAINYLDFLSKYYGNNLKVIFLTSGYEPFIRGVVDEILNKTNLNLNYIVIGSQIQINNEKIYETFHMSQDEKKEIVEYIIKSGGKIRFLADDCTDNLELFNIVEKNGGIALKINHAHDKKENNSWNKFWLEINKDSIKKELINSKEIIGISDLKYDLPIFLDTLEKHTNDIGITHVSKSIFYKSLFKIMSKISILDDRQKFKTNIEKMIYIKDNDVYLRGKLYYNWLPQYIFANSTSLNERWKDLVNTSLENLKIICSHDLVSESNSFENNLLIYCTIDNFLEGIFYILNLVEQNSLNGNLWYEREHSKIITIIQFAMDMLYSIFMGYTKQVTKYLRLIIKEIEKLDILESLPSYSPKFKTMRELDNNITIFKFIKSLVDKLDITNLDYVISFPYGGITLGFALKSYMKVVLKNTTFPKLLNSHFSSKQRLREKRTEKDEDFSIFKFIPKMYDSSVDEIKKGKSKILLLDNNVTTFKTLDLCKNYLKQIGNEVYAGVAAINYDNIIRYLFNEECEILVPNWRNVLDFKPVAEYVTAFNTWNTSQKSKLLQQVYYIENDVKHITFEYNTPRFNQFIFKVCRVQNVQDLNTVIKNGANMIGIHAVYPDRIKYLKNELKYRPINTDIQITDNLPVGILELDSIRDIQRFIPADVKQAILFERELNIDYMIETIKLYNIKSDNLYIQLQHRTNEKYIKDIKDKVSKNVITTVGLFQKDFKEYFENMQNILNPQTDYILIDLSKHQPDLISYSEAYKEFMDRVSVLNNLLPIIENNKVPIIIADDTTTYQMNEYLKVISKYNIKISGIDMQNCVELNPNEQRYEIVECLGKKYQVKIRKSATKIAEWNMFFENLEKSIFYGGNYE